MDCRSSHLSLYGVDHAVQGVELVASPMVEGGTFVAQLAPAAARTIPRPERTRARRCDARIAALVVANFAAGISARSRKAFIRLASQPRASETPLVRGHRPRSTQGSKY